MLAEIDVAASSHPDIAGRVAGVLLVSPFRVLVRSSSTISVGGTGSSAMVGAAWCCRAVWYFKLSTPSSKSCRELEV